MYAKMKMPAFFIFSLLGTASRHRFMQRIAEIRDEARGVGLFLVSLVFQCIYFANLFCLIPIMFSDPPEEVGSGVS